MSDQVLASDGLPARPSGEWAKDKHWILDRYLEIFTGGQKHKWPERAYLDLLAGPGRCVIVESGDEFDGSPLIALKTKEPFTRAFLVEADPTLCTALRARVNSPVLRPAPIIRQADCNDPIIVAEMQSVVDSGTLACCFVDLLGFTVSFDTIRALTRDRRIDLIITFPEQHVARNAGLALASQADDWDRFFGCSTWRTVVQTSRAHRLAQSAQHALTGLYAAQLGTLGYGVRALPWPMVNSRDAPLYRPIFASKHPLGLEYWEKISAIDRRQQRRLSF